MSSNFEFFQKRRAGILLHPTSLPGTPGNGDLGDEAFRFVDFLADSGISLWQMLPLGPPHEDLSPYQCQSVHAANPLLISLKRLVDKGWLSKETSPTSEHDLQKPLKYLAEQGWLTKKPEERELEQRLEQSRFRDAFCPPEEREEAIRYRHACLKAARAGFKKHAGEADRTAFAEFIEAQAHWLEDYALFRALQAEHHQALKAECLKAFKEIQDDNALQGRLLELRNVSGWWGWRPELRDRNPQALDEARRRLAEVIEQHRFEQFVFFSQWEALKEYAHDKDVLMFGDIPIFVAEDSVDVWASRENFILDGNGRPTVVAGVPPDYFSATGQRWGNPHYNWGYMQNNGFKWWLARLKSAKLLFDVVRIDHFRGFEAYWEIPAHCDTAIEGQWVKVPGHQFFESIQQSDINLPLVAEDLGIITDEVNHLRDRFGLPGMKILQFAFDGGHDNPYLPHNHIEHCIVYTGTHDNNTTLGWFHEIEEQVRQNMCNSLGVSRNNIDMPWALVEAAFKSPARWAIVPMQDVLVLDGSHRMNVPGVEKGNWRWRFNWSQMPHDLIKKLGDFGNKYGRG